MSLNPATSPATAFFRGWAYHDAFGSRFDKRAHFMEYVWSVMCLELPMSAEFLDTVEWHEDTKYLALQHIVPVDPYMNLGGVRLVMNEHDQDRIRIQSIATYTRAEGARRGTNEYYADRDYFDSKRMVILDRINARLGLPYLEGDSNAW